MRKVILEVMRKLRRLAGITAEYSFQILIVSLMILLFLGGIARIYLTMSDVERKLQEVSVEA